MKQKGFALPLILIGILLLVGVGIGAYYFGRQNNNLLPSQTPTPKACTEEGKQCPDGSYVSRSGPNCEFAGCPNSLPSPIDETANWKTYSIKNTFELKYPTNIEVWRDEENDSYVAFYRKNVAASKGNNKDDVDRLCCGLSIYLRGPNGMIESRSRPVENITIAGYSAFRWIDNVTYMEDIWIENPDKGLVVRFSITTIGELPQFQKADFETYTKIINTLKFL